jgi:hypothetical protein
MLTVLITCENRGRWTLKARPGETASARDSLDQLATMGCVDAETAATVRRVFDALDDHTVPLADTPRSWCRRTATTTRQTAGARPMNEPRPALWTFVVAPALFLECGLRGDVSAMSHGALAQ